MALQLRLILSSLRLKKNNLILSSYRQSVAFSSLGVNLSPWSKGGAAFLTGLFSASLAPRASTMKRYTFGFDATLIPLKNSSSSLPLLKKLPLSSLLGVTATSSLGAWGSKFNSPGWFRQKFLKKKALHGALKSGSYFFFSSFTAQLWLSTFSPLISLLNLSATQFSWWYLSAFNPGFSFYRNLEVLAAFPDSKTFPSSEQLKLMHLHQFFFNSPGLLYQGDLSVFTPEDLTYQIPVKRSIYASYAGFTPYLRLYNFKFLGDNNVFLVYFFFNLISLGLWVLMAVPKHKRYKRSSGLTHINLFSVAKRALYPNILALSHIVKFQNQPSYAGAQRDHAEVETSCSLVCAPLGRYAGANFRLVDSLVDAT